MLGDENESPVWRQNGNVDQEDGAGFLNRSFRAVVLPQAESEPRVHFYAGLVFSPDQSFIDKSLSAGLFHRDRQIRMGLRV
jgi:hypothetical protein